MRAAAEKIPLTSESFRYRVRDDPRFEFRWHFHPEYELTLIVQSRGRRIVGDSVEDYRDGDLVLLGPNLPHAWGSSPGPRRRHRSIVLQFSGSFLGAGFFERPEVRDVARMLAQSATGLSFTGQARDRAARLLGEMQHLRGLDRLLALLSALGALARSPDVRPLASPGFRPALDLDNRRRIDSVCAYIHHNHTRPISQPEMAHIAHLSPSAFSRFFKRMIGKTFIDYLHEIRIGHACELLIEGDLPITEVAYASGFSNLSNFNRRFLEQKRMTPRTYRAQFFDAEGER